MARQDNLHTGEAARQAANQKRLAFGSPGENWSIDRGRFRVGGSARILIDGSGGIVVQGTLTGGGTFTWTGTTNLNGPVNIAGTQTVTGTQNITGAMNVNGPLNVAGTETVTGALNVNGPWNLAGTGGITGNVSSTGAWTQTGDYTVAGAGKIRVGNMEFRPGTVAGTVGTIYSPTTIYIDANSLQVRDQLTVGTDAYFNGPVNTQSSVFLRNLPIKTGTGAAAGFLWIDPTTKRVHVTG